MLMLMTTKGNLQRGKEKHRMASSHELGSGLSDQEVAEKPAAKTEPPRVL
jgi:hypothetical protein